MSGLGALLGGMGIGAAQAYYNNKNEEAENAFQDKRDEALRDPTKEMPKRVKQERNIDMIAGKIKGFLSGDKPAGDAATPVAPIAPIKPIASTEPVVDTAAFNDDATVPNEPVPFKSSYA